MRRTLFAVGLIGIGVLCSVPAVARIPQEPRSEDPGSDQDWETVHAARGAVLYRLHCGSCHGKTAHGDGPLAAELKLDTPDLTRIRDRYDGGFPRDELARIIDGRTEMEAHGSRKMPIWGLSFRQRGRLHDQEEQVWLQIRDLVRYLESIQDEADGEGVSEPSDSD